MAHRRREDRAVRAWTVVPDPTRPSGGVLLFQVADDEAYLGLERRKRRRLKKEALFSFVVGKGAHLAKSRPLGQAPTAAAGDGAPVAPASVALRPLKMNF